jgi:uroporphyrinogen-III synthase
MASAKTKLKAKKKKVSPKSKSTTKKAVSSVAKKRTTAKKATNSKLNAKKTLTRSVSKTKKLVAKKVVKTVQTKKVAVANGAKKKEEVKQETSTGSSFIKERKKRGSVKVTFKPAPLPTIEISNHPKSKIKTLLISQPKPVDNDKNPYLELSRKYNLIADFRQFIKVEGINPQDFRAQRIDILAHGAVILTSKLSVDHYFRICNEMRVTVPETMKYFCINEQTAYYLQKYIQYRKRKIFFGHGTILDLVDVIRKNKNEKFLLPVSDVHKEQIVEFLDEMQLNYTKGTFYKTVSANLSDIKNLGEYDALVFFTPAGIKSLKHNFPNFKQGNTRIAAFGHATALMVKEQGYRLDMFAPNPLNPSMTSALESYLKESNKR